MIKELILFILLNLHKLLGVARQAIWTLVFYTDMYLTTDTSTYSYQLMTAKNQDWLDSL